MKYSNQQAKKSASIQHSKTLTKLPSAFSDKRSRSVMWRMKQEMKWDCPMACHGSRHSPCWSHRALIWMHLAHLILFTLRLVKSCRGQEEDMTDSPADFSCPFPSGLNIEHHIMAVNHSESMMLDLLLPLSQSPSHSLWQSLQSTILKVRAANSHYWQENAGLSSRVR